MKKTLLLLPLVFVVFLSGCTIPGIGESVQGIASGVVIKEFKPEISEIYSGDSVIFMLVVENVGEEEAKNVVATFMGVGTDWRAVDPTSNSREIGLLAKSEPNIAGGMVETTFEQKSPDNLVAANTYPAKVRVSYEYASTAYGKLKVYNYEDYIKTLSPSEAEKIMKSSAIDSFGVTKAPISIALAGVARPLIFRTTSGSSNKAVVTIVLSNIGQGQSYLNDIADRKVEIVSATINVDSSGRPVRCENWAQINKNPTIPRSGQTSFSCQFSVPDVPMFKTIPIEVKLRYKYYVYASSQIKVLQSFSAGTGGSSSGGTTTTSGGTPFIPAT